MSKQRKFMKDMMQESNGSHFWSIPSADNFVNTKTTVISVNQTPLTNGDIEFSVRSSDKYTHVNTIEFHLNVVLQKLEGGVWKNVPDADPVVVLPGAVMNLLREHLEVKMVHPGEAEDTSVINIKQDERRYLSRNEIQRSYDKLYCEKELSDDMQIIKELLTYPYEFATTGTDAAYAAGKPLHGLRPRNAKILFEADNLYSKCLAFGKELAKGKDYVIKGSILDPIFTTPLLPPFHGFNISMKLGKDEDHMRYIEDYNVLAAATTTQTPYRFYLQKTGGHKVKCRYDTSSLTTAALARYNDQFENNNAVDVATFMVYKLDHRNVEKDATEHLNFKFPNTSNMPSLATIIMMDRDDFNHTDVRANYYSNTFLNTLSKSSLPVPAILIRPIKTA